MKTEVHFHSTAFNCTVPQAHFINKSCFGEDVCRWLITQLRVRGFQTAADPDQEDFGWYFTFHAGGGEHCFVVSFQPNDAARGDQWLGWVERQVGLFGSRRRDVCPEAVQAIDTALASSPDVQAVSWRECTL